MLSSLTSVRYLIRSTMSTYKESQTTWSRDPLLLWRKSYLSDRKQFIKIIDTISILSDIPSGIPQGGHLSPLLFILFTNSKTKWITKARVLLFSNDIKMFMRIDSPDSFCSLLNELDIFLTWTRHLGVSLYLDKCNIISFTRNRNPILHYYILNGTPLQQVFIYKDYGIFLLSALELRTLHKCRHM